MPWTGTLDPGTSYQFHYLAEGGRWFDDPEFELRERGNGVVLARPLLVEARLWRR